MLRAGLAALVVVVNAGCGGLMPTAPDLTGVWTGQISNAKGKYNLTLYFSDATRFADGLKYTAKLVVSGSTIPFDAAADADNGTLQMMTTLQVTEVAGTTTHPGEELTLNGTATATALSGTLRAVGPQAPGDLGTFTASK